MKNFWHALSEKKKPFFVLAPMEDVTDTVFRRVVAAIGAPDVFFTEFTSVDGIFSRGSEFVGRRLDYTEEERPLIAQIWGLQPENFYKAAVLLQEREFDGIDINMGCPSKEVTSKGACSALIKNHTLATEIITATQEGAGNLPVSVKTRIGYATIQTEEWISFLLEHNLQALTVHGRTVKEMSKVPAHWDEIGKAAQIRNDMKKDTVILGNGDVKSVADGKEKAATNGLDGIMIGRGIFENAWVFNEAIDPPAISIKQRTDILLRHLELYESHRGDKHSFQTLKKFFKIYMRDFDGASELRMKLMEAKTSEEVKEIISVSFPK